MASAAPDREPRLRSDARRNRERILAAASEVFAEQGMEASTDEIAARAGVGHATVFRRFPTKEHLIAAIVVERMHESLAGARALLEAPDPGEALFDLIDQSVGRSQTDRALFDALADTWLANDEIRAAHSELIGVLEALLVRAQEAGAVRRMDPLWSRSTFSWSGAGRREPPRPVRPRAPGWKR